MKYRSVDVAVIGAESAGMRAFRAAKAWTDNVVLIEGGEYGTTCARVGCMPSKLLIAAGAAPYKRDLKDLEYHLIDTGHFALETHGQEISDLMRDFLNRKVDRTPLAAN